MKKENFSKTAPVNFLESIEGKFVAFSPSQPTDETGRDLDFEIILVTDDKLSFCIGTDQAKGLLKQLKHSIDVCECFNFKV